MRRFTPEEVWVEAGEIDSPVARTVLSRIGGCPVRVTDDLQAADRCNFAAGKRRLVLRRNRGSFLEACPAGTVGLVCCNYLALNLGTNCPSDCSYCFLQEYVANNPALKVFTNIEDALLELDKVMRAHPERTFRVGTGELMDSLALDSLAALSRYLVPFFAVRPNAVLELKTKSDCVEELLALDPRGKVVVSWSLNLRTVMEEEELGTATLDERLAAAARVQSAGYRLGFHFDPLVEGEGWEAGYREIVEYVFARVHPRHVAWISLGSLRLTPGLIGIMRSRGLSRRALRSELVCCDDGKHRVWRGLRLRMYRVLLGLLKTAAPGVPVYLCMEQPQVWERVMGEVPSARGLAVRLSALEAR